MTISLAKKQKGLPNVVFVKVNYKMLDRVHIPKVDQFPTIKLFSLKYSQGIEFNQDRTPEHLLHFIKQHADKIKKGGRKGHTRQHTRRRTRRRTRKHTR